MKPPYLTVVAGVEPGQGLIQLWLQSYKGSCVTMAGKAEVTWTAATSGGSGYQYQCQGSDVVFMAYIMDDTHDSLRFRIKPLNSPLACGLEVNPDTLELAVPIGACSPSSTDEQFMFKLAQNISGVLW